VRAPFEPNRFGERGMHDFTPDAERQRPGCGAETEPHGPQSELADIVARPDGGKAIGVGETDTCARCGTFLRGEADGLRVDGVLYCTACGVRPDVDYLEAYRASLWGKRDGWVWFIGLTALYSLLQALVVAASSRLLVGSGLDGIPSETIWRFVGRGAVELATCAVAVAYFLGRPWARLGFVGVFAMQVSSTFVTSPPGMRGFVLVASVLSLPVLLFIVNGTRQRLFFKLEVSRAKLKASWEVYANNPMARQGLMLALLSLAVPPLGPLALGMSIVGLRRVDPAARPPIGRKRQAIAGMVFSSLSSAVSAGWLALKLFK